MADVQPTDTKLYACKEPGCHKKFQRREHLARHIRNHMPDKAYICAQCQKRFFRKDLYQRHVDRHNKGMWYRRSGNMTTGSQSIGTTQLPVASSDHQDQGDHSPYLDSKPTKLDDPSDSKRIAKSAEVPLVANKQMCQTSSFDITEKQAFRIPSARDETVLSECSGNSDGRYVSVFGDSAAVEGPSFLNEDISWLFDFPEGRTEMFNSLNEEIFRGSKTPSLPPERDLEDVELSLPSEDLSEEAKWQLTSSKIVRYLFGVSGGSQGCSPIDACILPEPYYEKIINSGFFEPSILRSHFYHYFENYHDHFPILHAPSFQKNPHEIHPLLVVSIATLGSAFGPPGYYEVSVELHNRLRWLIMGYKKLIPPPLWILQSLALVQAFEKMLSSRYHHELATTFHGALVSLLRRGQVYVVELSAAEQEQSDPLNIRQLWKQWIEFESTKRLVYFVFIMDAQHTVLFGHRPSMSSNEIQLELPCSESIFELSSPYEWWQTYGAFGHSQGEPLFLTVLKSLLYQRPLSASSSHFSRLILLHGLYSISWQVQHHDAASFGIIQVSNGSEPRVGEEWRKILLKAIKTWSYSLFSQQSLSIEVCKSLHKILYVMLHLTRSCLVDILVFADFPSLDGRPLGQRDFARATHSVGQWAASQDALICIRHALMLIQETLFLGSQFYVEEFYAHKRSRYSARLDKVAFRPWCLFVCTLTVWAYLKVTCDDDEIPLTQFEAGSWVLTEEFLATTMQMLSQILDGDDVNIKIKKRLLPSLIMTVDEALAGTRWEMLDQARDCLGKLLHRC